KQEKENQQSHSRLLESRAVSWALIGPQLQRSINLLKDLHDRGSIPKSSIPLLRDRLALVRCICGASLAQGTSGRLEVEALIEQERAADDQQRLLTSLFHTAIGDLEDSNAPGNQFTDLWNTLRLRRLGNLSLTESAEKDLRFCEEKLGEID